MAQRICTYPGCEAEHKARGYCMRHYGLLRSRGDLPPLARPDPASLPGERWLPVAGWDYWYAVSDLGRLRRLAGSRQTPTARLLRPTKGSSGYLKVELQRAGVSQTWNVHALVAEAFIGPRPEGYQVNHKNGIKTDNRLANLEWTTPAGNNRHAQQLGLVKPVTSEEQLSHAKLTAEQVREIRRLRGTVSGAALAARFGVGPRAIGRIWSGERWRWLK